MNDHEQFWLLAKKGAANLNLEIRVHPDGRLGLHHLKWPDDEGRPDEKQVDTFRAFLSRHRDEILAANGIDPARAPGIAQDARRLLAWLDSHADSPECVLETPCGDKVLFRRERARLVQSFAEDGRWILAAHRFQKAVRAAVSWADLEGGPLPELWGMEQGLSGRTTPENPPCPPAGLADYRPPAAAKNSTKKTEATLFDD